MSETTLTQSIAHGRVIDWTNFSHQHSVHGFRRFSEHVFWSQVENKVVLFYFCKGIVS